jgi:hypothetical protein
MKLPRKAVTDRQAETIRDTFENVDDAALAMLSGGQPRYGLVAPPPDKTLQPAPAPQQGTDLLGPLTATTSGTGV